jgi:hypothetical protein
MTPVLIPCSRSRGGMGADVLQCSRNARPRKVLVGRAQSRVQQTSFLFLSLSGLEGGERGIHVGAVLPERAASEGPRSTAALRPTWVPVQERESERAWREYAINNGWRLFDFRSW